MSEHKKGECFHDDPTLTKEEVCLACAWYRLQHFNDNTLTLSLSDSYENSVRSMRQWLRTQNKGEISVPRLQNMLRGMRFQRLLVHRRQDDKKIYYTAALQHEGGQTYGGLGSDASSAIGDAVRHYIDQLVGVTKSADERRA